MVVVEDCVGFVELHFVYVRVCAHVRLWLIICHVPPVMHMASCALLCMVHVTVILVPLHVHHT